MKLYPGITCLEAIVLPSLALMKNHYSFVVVVTVVVLLAAGLRLLGLHSFCQILDVSIPSSLDLGYFPLKHEQSIPCQALKEDASPESVHLTPEHR